MGAGRLRPDSGISPPFCISLYRSLGESGVVGESGVGEASGGEGSLSGRLNGLSDSAVVVVLTVSGPSRVAYSLEL